MVVVYSALALVGLVGTWWFNALSIGRGEDYLGGWFATPASSSAAVDVVVVAVVVCVFLVLEARRLGMPRWAWALVPLTFAVAVAFTFPAFLAWRELHLRRTRPVVPAAPVAGRTGAEVGR